MTDETTSTNDSLVIDHIHRANLERRLGATILDVLSGQIGDDAAMDWARCLIDPTKPGTPERKRQDGYWDKLTLRLTQVGKKAAE